MIRKLLQKFLTPEVIKFLVVGGLSAFLEFSLLILFVERAAMDYLYGNILAFGITNIFTYLLSRKYVFPASGQHRAYEAAMFFICLLGGLLVNQVVLWVMVEFTAIDYRIAKVIAILVTVIWNYFTRKHIVFRNRAVPVEERSTDF